MRPTNEVGERQGNESLRLKKGAATHPPCEAITVFTVLIMPYVRISLRLNFRTLCSRERSSASVTWGPEALIRRSARRSEAARPSRGVLRPEKGSACWSETACLPRGATRLHMALRLLEEAADVLKEERQAERCPGKGLSCN
ncbi:hypothetical protein NDU88_005131 [Pleurodeles waltl]|uniref:Uncharacterized protein n=1 Tax=Pleurodeles waltl TaxID=8319 RepID=A0AAV7WTV9_PLEWA|nr:hypothetical protein NDU88_005131 [Pleurodeles waltl]